MWWCWGRHREVERLASLYRASLPTFRLASPSSARNFVNTAGIQTTYSVPPGDRLCQVLYRMNSLVTWMLPLLQEARLASPWLLDIAIYALRIPASVSACSKRPDPCLTSLFPQTQPQSSPLFDQLWCLGVFRQKSLPSML